MKAFANFQKYVDDIKSPVIVQLVEDFGPEIVFSNERKFSIDDQMLEKIFDSLNKSFFNSRLPKVKMGAWSFKEIKAELIKRAKDCKTTIDMPDVENAFYGVYSVMIENELDGIKSEDDI